MRDAVLYVLFHADAPGEPPSRHRLTGIDSVTITAGPPAAHRRGNSLSLQLPDPRMATSPAAIRQRYDAWTVDGPATATASSDPGRARLVSRVAGGDVFLVGNAVMSIEREELPDGAAHDTVADDAASPLPGFTALAPAQERVLAAIAGRVSARAPVHVRGERGMDIEAVARALHLASGRRGRLVYCGVASDDIDGEELQRRAKAADGGTLFIVGVEDLSMPQQRVLMFTAWGRFGDVQIGAASACDLSRLDPRAFLPHVTEMLGEPIALVPLGSRRCDIGARIAHALATSHTTTSVLHPIAALALHRYRWRFHERELRRIVHRAAYLAAGGPIGSEHLPDEIAQLGCEPNAVYLDDDLDAESAARREQLTTLLLEHRGRVGDVATAVGKRREQIYRWSMRLGIDLQSFRR